MKLKVLAVLVAIGLEGLLPTTAQAVQWLEMGESARVWLYLDVDSVKRRGNTVQYWDQTVLKKPDENGVTSFKHFNVMNCTTGSYRVLREISYIDGQAKSDVKSNELLSIVPGSIGESTSKRVCKR